MIKNKNNLIYFKGNKNNLKSKLNVYILDMWLNKDVLKIVDKKYSILNYNISNKNIVIQQEEYYKIADIGKGELYLNKKIPPKYIPVILFFLADVIIVGRVSNINLGLDVVDMALTKGKEIICISGNSGKSWYLSRHLIKDGATFI